MNAKSNKNCHYFIAFAVITIMLYYFSCTFCYSSEIGSLSVFNSEDIRKTASETVDTVKDSDRDKRNIGLTAGSFLSEESENTQTISGTDIKRIKAVTFGELVDKDGHIDVGKTIEALKEVNSNAIVLVPTFQKKWEGILNFLPEANKNNVKVYILLPDARDYGIGPCGFCNNLRCKKPLPYCRDYIKWIEELAKLSLKYPVLEGVFIDDFECGARCGKNPGFTLEYIEKVIETKNSINPKFRFLPGIYLPQGLSDFKIGQKRDCEQGKTISLTASVNYRGQVKDSFFEVITSWNQSSNFTEQILINGDKKFERSWGSLHLEKIDLYNYDLSNLTITYKLIKTGDKGDLKLYSLLRLLINGKEEKLNWKIDKDECYTVKEYYKWIKQYYDLADGVIFWSNSFNLVKPQNQIIEKLLDISKEKIGKNKIIFGHFYGIEPWQEPVFPSEDYFNTFAGINIQKTDGVSPWYGFLLPYYVHYSNTIFSQQKNNDVHYDYRFTYPDYTSYELGFYQGIKADITLPQNISDANITFEVTDDKSKPVGKWVKELVIRTEKFEHNSSCKNVEECLWIKENKTIWWEPFGNNKVRKQISINLLSYINPGESATIILRMRADKFSTSGVPSAINAYVTKPKLMINGKEIELDWTFLSGNSLEKLWLKSSEKIKELFLRYE